MSGSVAETPFEALLANIEKRTAALGRVTRIVLVALAILELAPTAFLAGALATAPLDTQVAGLAFLGVLALACFLAYFGGEFLGGPDERSCRSELMDLPADLDREKLIDRVSQGRQRDQFSGFGVLVFAVVWVAAPAAVIALTVSFADGVEAVQLKSVVADEASVITGLGAAVIAVWGSFLFGRLRGIDRARRFYDELLSKIYEWIDIQELSGKEAPCVSASAAASLASIDRHLFRANPGRR